LAMVIRADLHVHTSYSLDGRIRLDGLIRRVQELGIGAVAVTDHNTITGALRLRDRNPPFKVIVGEEVAAVGGEIIGLFLKERVKPRMSFEETVAAIREQGGLVYLPHPVSRLVPSKVKASLLEKALEASDIVEVVNGRTMFRSDQRRAAELAERYGKPTAAGSDAHVMSDLGNCWTEMEDFECPRDFLDKLKTAKLIDNKKTSVVKAAYLTIFTFPLFFFELCLGVKLTK